MRKIDWLKPWGLVSIFSFLLVFSVLFLINDPLLFHSDFLSMAALVIAMTMAITIILTIVSLPFLLIPKNIRLRIYTGFAIVLILLLIAFFSVYAVIFIIDKAGIMLLQKFSNILIIAITIVILLGVALYLKKQKSELISRLEQIGILILFMLIIGSISITSIHAISSISGNKEKDEKHLVLIVLDGMPSHYLQTYEPSAEPNLLDSIASQALVFKQMRSVAPYTNAFYGMLYSGYYPPYYNEGNEDKAGQNYNDNLLDMLQHEGVVVRWIANVRNATPEGSGAHIDRYNGLRSYLLTNNTAWMPGFLGLDYHLHIASDATIQENLPGKFAQWLFNVSNNESNRYRNFDNSLLEVLLPQMKQIQKRSDRTFLLFHIHHASIGKYNRLFSLPQAQYSTEDLLFSEVVAQIRGNNYRYTPDQEYVAEKIRENQRACMIEVGEYIFDFINAVENDSSLNNTTIIITADHGTMAEKGCFWYGYHPNEEALRVPFFVFNGDKKGNDDRLLGTPDLHKSILDFFNIEDGQDSKAISIFSDSSRDYTAHLTLKSHKRNEQFVILVTDESKYVCNICPSGNGETSVFKVNNFDEVLIETVSGPPDEIKYMIGEALDRFSLQPDEVHYLYNLQSR